MKHSSRRQIPASAINGPMFATVTAAPPLAATGRRDAVHPVQILIEGKIPASLIDGDLGTDVSISGDQMVLLYI